MENKNNKDNERVNKKTLVLIMLMLVVLVVLVVGVTYQVYMYTGTNESIINKIIGREPTPSNDNNDNNQPARYIRPWWWWIPIIGGDDEPKKEDEGQITVIYREGDNAISIENAIPMSDEAGKALQNDNEYMDFTVSVNMTKKKTIKYQVVAAKENDSTIQNQDIKLYLERSSNNIDYEEIMAPTVYLPIEENNEYGSKKGNMILDEVETDKNLIYYYRLRMWISNDYQMDNEYRTFKARVNVNAKEK